jgi:hypothetical protein
LLKNVLYKNKMGLRILASVETPQGFTASALYLRIVSLFVMRPQSLLPLVKIRTALYLSRDRQSVAGSEVDFPAIPREYDIEIQLTSVSSFELLYAHIRAILRRRGYTCEAVAEDGQTIVEVVLPEPVVVDVSGTVMDASGIGMDVSGVAIGASQQSSESTQPTPQTPPQPEEPPAASPEPQPQPSSEYAPAPAETEA